MKQFLIKLILCLLVATPLQAEEIFVNNAPYKGKVAVIGSKVFLELSALRQFLNLDSAKNLLIKDIRGQAFADIESLGRQSDFRMIRSAELQTVDIYGPKALTAAPVIEPSSETTPIVQRKGAEDPTTAVISYFRAIKRLSAELDFRSDQDIDRYLATHRRLLTRRSFEAHKPGIEALRNNLQSAIYFDRVMDGIANTKVRILEENRLGERAKVKAELTVGGTGSRKSVFNCYLEDGSWKLDLKY